MNASTLLEQARQHTANAQPLLAERLYERILKQERNPEALAEAGQLRLEQRDFTAAQPLIKEAIQLAPNFPQALYALAQLYAHTKRHADALPLYKQLLSLMPEHKQTQLAYAISLTECGHPQEASDIAKSLAGDPTFAAQATYILGKIAATHGEKGQDLARKHYLLALDINPQTADALYALGCQCQDARQFEWAEENFSKLIKQEPTHTRAYLRLAELMHAQDKASKRRTYLEKAYKLEPESPDTLTAYAQLLLDESADNAATALAFALCAQRAEPDNGAALHCMSLAHEQLGHHSQAIRYAQKSLKSAQRVEIFEAFARQYFPGTTQREHLEYIHEHLRPKTYLQLGLGNGEWLSLAKHSQYRVGVDAAPRIQYNTPAPTRIFTQDSHDVLTNPHLLGEHLGSLVDMLVVGGAQPYTKTLRELTEAEVHGHPKTLVVILGAYPIDDSLNSHEPHPHYWLGDNWKTVCILRKLLPNAPICTLPSHPGGMALMGNLGAISTLDEGTLNAAIKEYATTLPSEVSDLDSLLNLIGNDIQQALSTLDLSH